MGIVRLGALLLRWCNNCSLPILSQKECGTCGEPTHEVQVTPPGDIRPAFDNDINIIREIVSEQFGPGTGELLLPKGKLVLLNRAPGLDTIDEIIVDGIVVGSLVYDILTEKFKVIMRQNGAEFISPLLKKGYVIVDDGAVNPIRNGGSVLIPGILDIASDIEKGNEIVVLDKSEKVLATGMAKMSSEEIKGSEKGSAVKNRFYKDFQSIHRSEGSQSWEDAVKANSKELDYRITKAVRFIQNAKREAKKPVVVSFSGGKDSLATLLLVLDAKLSPELLFVDTGLELPETLEYIKEISEKYKLELNVESAAESFWEHVGYFGPPGKDFRWCCKTCKLGPATRLIKRKYPEGVLSFIGQRSYESEPRSRKGPIWRNPWVPGQYAASPIQKWTALHVWLYLFSKNAPVNPWYHRGLDRIGCFMCPASNLSELNAIKKYYGDYNRWEEHLQEYASSRQLNESWQKFGLWRWRKPPGEIVEMIKTRYPDSEIVNQTTKPIEPVQPEVEGKVPSEENGVLIYSIRNYKFLSAGGYEDCKGGISLEGIFNFQIDLQKCSNLLNIIEEVTVDEQTRSISIGDKITLFDNGALSIQAEDAAQIERILKKIHKILVRANDCVECGICVGRCSSDALSLNSSGLTLDPSKCTHCGECLKGPCTVIDFDADREIEF